MGNTAPVWCEDRRARRQLHPSQQDRASQSNSKGKKNPTTLQPNNRAFLWQRLADATVFIICLRTPLISPPMGDQKKNPLFNQQ